MKATTVSIRELRRRLSHYIQLAKAGQTVQITERGIPVARVVGNATSVEDRIGAMVDTGLLAWNRQRLAPREPVALAAGKRTVAGLLIMGRQRSLIGTPER